MEQRGTSWLVSIIAGVMLSSSAAVVFNDWLMYTIFSFDFELQGNIMVTKSTSPWDTLPRLILPMVVLALFCAAIGIGLARLSGNRRSPAIAASGSPLLAFLLQVFAIIYTVRFEQPLDRYPAAEPAALVGLCLVTLVPAFLGIVSVLASTPRELASD